MNPSSFHSQLYHVPPTFQLQKTQLTVSASRVYFQADSAPSLHQVHKVPLFIKVQSNQNCIDSTSSQQSPATYPRWDRISVQCSDRMTLNDLQLHKGSYQLQLHQLLSERKNKSCVITKFGSKECFCSSLDLP